MLFLNFGFSKCENCDFQMQIGLPITGKYRDPESDQYYNNNNVSNLNCAPVKLKLKIEICFFSVSMKRAQKYCKHHTSIMNTFLGTKLHFYVWPKEIHVHISRKRAWLFSQFLAM